MKKCHKTVQIGWYHKNLMVYYRKPVSKLLTILILIEFVF
jgi:hypothetical protein